MTGWGKRCTGIVAVIAMLVLVAGCTLTSSGKRDPIPADQITAPTAEQTKCLTYAQTPYRPLDATAAGYIDYVEQDADVRQPVTKFGGQPVWLEDPEWPVSAWDGSQQQFVGQVALDRFTGGAGKMAYLFVTGDPDLDFHGGAVVFDSYPETWDPFGGDNAVIVQPGGSTFVPTVARETGPTLEGVYSADLTEREDAKWLSDQQLADLGGDGWETYQAPMEADKIGGTPVFIQGSWFPDCGRYSTLALQLTAPPFGLNLGDGGFGYLLLDDTSTSGVFFWQN